MKTKNQLLKSSNFLILLLSMTFFTYCQKEDVNNTILNKGDKTVLQMRYIVPSELNQNIALTDKLKEIKSSPPTSLSRTVYNQEHDIFIETDHVKFMASPDGVFHSYTFPITQDSAQQSIKNLVLYSYNDMPYESALIRYNLTENQRTELNETDHVSSTYTVDVERLDDDFSNLLNRDDDPCDYIAVTYHVTPDTQETWVFDENSVCQHINPETGETECFVHTITYLDCPDSVDGSGTTTDDGNDPDWTWSYTGGGSGGNSSGNTKAIGSSPAPPMFTKMFSIFMNSLPADQQDLLNSSIEHFNFKLDLQNFFQTNGYTNDNENFASELINTLMEHPTFSFNEVVEQYFMDLLGNDVSIVDSEDNQFFLNFDTVEEFEVFMNEFRNSITVDSNDFNPLINNQDGTTIINFKARFNTILPLYLNVNVKATLDDPSTSTVNEFEIDTVSSFMSGATLAIEWEQVSFFVSSVNDPFIEVTIQAKMNVGFILGGFDLSYKENWTAIIVINKNTGEAVDIDASSD